MKQFLVAALLMMLSLMVKAQGGGFVQYSGRTTTFTELRKITGTDSAVLYCLGRDTTGDGFGGFFRYVFRTGFSDDNMDNIKPNGVSNSGWTRLKNGTQLYKTVTFSGITLQTAYVVSHNAGFTPTYVIIQARSANAAVPSWVSAITGTTFTVNFASIPVIGTNNITFDYILGKPF